MAEQSFETLMDLQVKEIFDHTKVEILYVEDDMDVIIKPVHKVYVNRNTTSIEKNYSSYMML